ncbi:MAG: 1-(5-phosphoribosyl)-5-[(5-phosphoribosylamino)methylideneamino]imidazole-4-carboxamide isomerase [Elusimicrobia bacterium]|jgi:phosphoribosylformimino-5-aminoimidazole carboxamide ribotide isomerase|nr:1-(5-phosphoribosyl)-5-[(5-phosphoribosylamino)methylideneamino]imidazole-4-carboxamide isomerase [Elusimicrobiota bacterium]
MLVIPAIDLKGGNCVRLYQGKIDEETIYSKEPLTVAKLWQSQGAKRIHIVDLDGAFSSKNSGKNSGKMKNREIIYSIVNEIDIPVQTGGGIRDYKTVKELIKNGVGRVILGTSAISDRELLEKVISKWPDKIIVGIDSSSGKVAIDGWQDITDKNAIDLAGEMEGLGIKEIIITDIKKDGTLQGPSFKWIEKIADAVDISVIASGGVSTVEDIKKFKSMDLDNLTGVIVGKALYTGSMKLSEAIKETL